MLTLLEASKLNSGDVVQAAVVEMFTQESEVLRVLGFDDIQGNAYLYNREQTLPGIGFRGVNEAFAESTGIINPQMDPLVIAGGDLDVDRFIIKTNGESVRAGHERMKVKALAANIGLKFIKGDSESNPREFDGLQKRLTGAQLINGGAAGATSSGGDALSLAQLDAAIDAVDNPTHIVMSKDHARKLSAAAKSTSISGTIDYSKDDFGRRLMTYDGLPVLRLYGADGADTILPYTEANPGGGSAVGSSIYVLSIGEGKLKGIQNGTMDVRDLGELQTTPVYRTRVEWYMGIALLHGRAAARVQGIKNVAFVA